MNSGRPIEASPGPVLPAAVGRGCVPGLGPGRTFPTHPAADSRVRRLVVKAFVHPVPHAVAKDRSRPYASESATPHIRLPPPGRAEVELLGADVNADRLTLFEHEYPTRKSSLVALNLAGASLGVLAAPGGVAAQSTTLLRVGEGWVCLLYTSPSPRD